MTSTLNNVTAFECTLYNIKCELDELSKSPTTLYDCVKKKLEVSEREYQARVREQREYILTRDLNKIMRAMHGKRAYGESK